MPAEKSDARPYRLRGADHLFIDGAEHNLEIAGDVGATPGALEQLASATPSFTSDA
jgi:hypothetical protein